MWGYLRVTSVFFHSEIHATRWLLWHSHFTKFNFGRALLWSLLGSSRRSPDPLCGCGGGYPLPIGHLRRLAHRASVPHHFSKPSIASGRQYTATVAAATCALSFAPPFTHDPRFVIHYHSFPFFPPRKTSPCSFPFLVPKKLFSPLLPSCEEIVSYERSLIWRFAK